jgi:type IV pilus assembly protein PilA
MFYKALQKRRSNQNKNKKAFTLIELIVVIAIIGVLVAILVPTMTGFVQEANESTALANARTVYSVAQAEIAFAMVNDGGAPANADALKTLVDPQLGNMDGGYTLNYADGVLTSVEYTMADETTKATYPPEPEEES